MISVVEVNREGLTVAELRRFLERAQMSDVGEDQQPVVRISLGGKIKRVEVTAD